MAEATEEDLSEEDIDQHRKVCTRQVYDVTFNTEGWSVGRVCQRGILTSTERFVQDRSMVKHSILRDMVWGGEHWLVQGIDVYL